MTNLTKFVQKSCKHLCEIKKLHSTNLETEHGNRRSSSMRIFLMYIFLIEQYLVRLERHLVEEFKGGDKNKATYPAEPPHLIHICLAQTLKLPL